MKVLYEKFKIIFICQKNLKYALTNFKKLLTCAFFVDQIVYIFLIFNKNILKHKKITLLRVLSFL